MSTLRRPNEPDISPNLTPRSQLTLEEIDAMADAEHRHVDYDRHPLRVDGLEHYFDRADVSERFHIW